MGRGIRLAIFDLGGTIVDKYSLTPFLSFKETLGNHGIRVSTQDIVGDMGMSKYTHIQKILHTHKSDWNKIYNRDPSSDDIDNVYNDFLKVQKEKTKSTMTILPETKVVIDELQKSDIQIAVTTGFDQDTMILVHEKLTNHGIHIPENLMISSTCMNIPGRPDPGMIHELTKRANINNNSQVVKIDDTPVGIKEGIYAGCWTIGVCRWSVHMGVEEPSQMHAIDEYHDFRLQKLSRAYRILKDAGAHYVVSDLYGVVELARDL